MEGDEQRNAERLECQRKAREDQHDDEDEPDVIRFPHGAHRVRDCITLLFFAWAGCKQIPDTAAEVGAAQHGIRDERNDTEAGDEQLRHQANPHARDGGAAGRGRAAG